MESVLKVAVCIAPSPRLKKVPFPTVDTRRTRCTAELFAEIMRAVCLCMHIGSWTMCDVSDTSCFEEI